MNTELTEMMIPQVTLPTKPWENDRTDVSKFQKNDFIVVVNYDFNYPKISKLENTTSHHVIQKLKSIFTRHCISWNVMSDNSPQFSSKEFRQIQK